PQGNPVIATSHGAVTIPNAQALPLGSTVTFQWIEPPAQTIKQATAQQALPPLNLKAENQPWPALEQTLQTIAITNPIAGGMVANMMPRAGAQNIAPAIMFFMAALNFGDAKAWFGERGTDILRQAGRLDILERLNGDFSRVSQELKNTPS